MNGGQHNEEYVLPDGSTVDSETLVDRLIAAVATTTAVAVANARTVNHLQAENERLSEALNGANGLLRSAHAIAQRYEDDDKTNWTTFKRRINEALREQHLLMYPEAHSHHDRDAS